MRKAVATTGILPDQVRDYRLLLERWLDVVKGVPSLALSVFGESGGYPLVVVETERRDPKAPSLYLSAGIHGDEPAPVEALVQWAEAKESLPRLAGWNWMIFPCLNPWGLERNIRFDAEGRDLNRCYNSRKVRQIAAQLALMKGIRFDVAASLHEDYDARGFYLYEVAAKRPHWGESLCGELSPVMCPDPRRQVDGHSCHGGVIRRRITPGMMKGHPEAFQLHFRHAERTFTLETPSEEGLAGRIGLHREFLSILPKKLKTECGNIPKIR